MTRQPQWYDHSPRVRLPTVQSQMGLKKHHYKASGGDGIPKPKR